MTTPHAPEVTRLSIPAQAFRHTLSMDKQTITIVGAGLVGGLLATLLAQRGFDVEVFERRPDPRVAGFLGGRSINLALAERGWHGLRQAGLQERIGAIAVMMRGRMVHHLDGHTELLRYGRDDSEVIWSVNRGSLNMALLDEAEAAGARIHFARQLARVDWETMTLHFADGAPHRTSMLIGADGAGSALRAAMDEHRSLGERFEPLQHGYKELEIPPVNGTYAMEPNALHIWPRGNYMCIALPNSEGSFTVTLFLPNEGNPSFATLVTEDDAQALFARDFADALPLIPELREHFVVNPTGMLGTLCLDRWHIDGRALLIGDAAHAIVPFHGQGMNCGFEDAVELAGLLQHDSDIAAVFAEFEKRRKPNADAIAEMALENYVEMRDSVADARFLLMRALERQLADKYPNRFVPRYWMVTFSRIPYSIALERGDIQAAILRELTENISDLRHVDLARADALVRAKLSPLT
jgi:kynurenine 3-monooxygenase